MTNVDEETSLGTCCICGGSANVNTILMLPLKGDVRGHGWGCVVCNLPPDGACAVLCDNCIEPYNAGRKQLLVACRGFPGTDGRIPIDELTRPHECDARIDHNA